MIQIEHSEAVPKHALCLAGQEENPYIDKEKRRLRVMPPLWCRFKSHSSHSMEAGLWVFLFAEVGSCDEEVVYADVAIVGYVACS